jgi:hypothetical protein
LKAEFDKEQAVYYQLLFSGHPVAYRLGFLKDGTYYDWHTSFDPEYQKYHVGQMSVAYMIRNFMQHGVSQINFMAGEYQWKLDWSPDKAISSHYMYTSPSTNIMATILNWYYHHLRERLRGCYHRMMDNRVLRMVSRNLILLRQKMNGRR